MIVSTRVRQFLERTRDAHPPLARSRILHKHLAQQGRTRPLLPGVKYHRIMYNVSSGLRSVEILQTLVFELIIHVLFKLKPWQPHGEHNASRSRRDVPAEQDCIILHKLCQHRKSKGTPLSLHRN